MAEPVHILVLEHSAADVLLLMQQLRNGGYEPIYVVVETPEAMRTALDQHEFQLVLAGYSLPEFSAPEALKILLEREIDLPFIVVTDIIEEEAAVSMMRAGAHDFIPKGRLTRLIPALERELREARMRRERREAEIALRESEARYRQMVETAGEGIWLLDAHEHTVYVNEQMTEMLGYPREEMLGRALFEFMDEDDYREALQCMAERKEGSPHSGEFHFRRKDGSDLWAIVSTTPMVDAHGNHAGALGMLTDITERRRAEEERDRLLAEAQAARAEAEEANATKDRFLAILSHELRNPLAPILSGITLLERRLPPDPQTERTLEIISRNARLEARLVSDVLDLSRIVRGTMKQKSVPFRLDNVVRAALESQSSEVVRAGLSIQHHLQPGLWVMGDPDRLEQVVTNLLTNSTKFTPAGGRITVKLEKLPRCSSGGSSLGSESARIVVEDTGIGFAEDQRASMFDMFQQGTVGGQRSPGLGLGLALVKSFVTAHHGRVWAESEGPGKGSRFTVEIPLTAGIRAGMSRDPLSEDRGKGTLLLLEDNPDTRTLLVDNLEMLGYVVYAAGSGEEALDLLRRVRPNLILADVGLPGMNGYEFLRQARRLPGLSEVPAFAITGYGMEEDIRRAMDAGFADHFVKPMDVTDLSHHIQERLVAR